MSAASLCETLAVMLSTGKSHRDSLCCGGEEKENLYKNKTSKQQKENASEENRTLDLLFTRQAPCHLATEAPGLLYSFSQDSTLFDHSEILLQSFHSEKYF
jgi:hypothetical protein